MLSGHVGYWAMVLANLHAVADGRHRGCVAVRIESRSELACHLWYRFIFVDQGFDVLHKALKTSLGEAAHGLWATCFT